MYVCKYVNYQIYYNYQIISNIVKNPGKEVVAYRDFNINTKKKSK